MLPTFIIDAKCVLITFFLIFRNLTYDFFNKSVDFLSAKSFADIGHCCIDAIARGLPTGDTFPQPPCCNVRDRENGEAASYSLFPFFSLPSSSISFSAFKDPTCVYGCVWYGRICVPW